MASSRRGPRRVTARGRVRAAVVTAGMVVAVPAMITTTAAAADAAASTSPHTAAIDAILEAGIAEGYPDGSFRPGDAVTRAQMASFLGRALGLDPRTDGPFGDVARSPHRGMINAVAAARVAEGYADGTFRPSNGVTREQMASFLTRAKGLEPRNGTSFLDTAASGHRRTIEAVAAARIAAGYPDGTFRPTNVVTREQMASFVARAFDLVERPESAPTPPPSSSPPVDPADCDRVIPRSQREVTSARAGETLCLEPGQRGQLRLFGLKGTAQAPITVVNGGGVVDIVASGAYAGVEIRDSQHLRVTGSGVAQRCGARHTEAQQACGIRISRSSNGLTGKVRTQHLTVDHVEVGNVSSSGMGVHDKDLHRSEWVQRDIAFRDVYLHDIATEGHYHGASKYTAGDRILLDGVEIVRNLVVRTGRDGIQVGSAPRNCRIADNVVSHAGRSGESSHAFGIIVNRGAACDITGNRVSDSAGDGIYDQGLHGQTIANNTVLRSGLRQDGAGINVRQGDQARNNPDTPDYPRSTHLSNNRVDGTSEHGIRLRNDAGTDNRIRGNHLSGIRRGEAINLGSGVRADVRDNQVD
jgi:parallel beta-helix repeat protein